MAKIQVRNFPDDVYTRIAQAAADNERSIEGEVRYALMQAYPESQPAPLSLRERWQQETAQRLRLLTDRLTKDGFWRGRGLGSVLQLAYMAGEETPAYLFDCLDAKAPLSFDAAHRLAAATDCGSEWLLDGRGDMFPVESIGSHYDAFFQPEAPGNYRFHLIRLGKGPGLKSLFCIRHNSEDNRYAMGQVMGSFYLGHGMGSGGMGNLMRFLQYLKKRHWRLKMNSYIWDEEEHETGNHHPCMYLDSDHLTESSWLEHMLRGTAPSWMTGFEWNLDEVKNTPFGQREPAQDKSDEATPAP